MHNDLDLIIKQYPDDMNVLRVYAIGDVHVGSPQCDLGDFGLKNSKTNVYQATMQPREQIDYIYELFLPIAEKISACVPGNHEERFVREVSICSMLTLCSMWNISEVYRENVAITKYSFGISRSRSGSYYTFVPMLVIIEP